MRRLSILLLAFMAFFCSCSSSDETNISDNTTDHHINPIDEGILYSEIADFFQSNYPPTFEYLAFFGESDKNECLVINKTEDLLSHYSGEKSFPNIDLNKYTLIVGQEIMTKSLYIIKRQELLYEGGEYRLNIYVPKLDGGYHMIQHLFYWGIYPKLNTSKLSVKIIEE